MRATTYPTSRGPVTIPATLRHHGSSVDDAIKEDIEAWRRSGAFDTIDGTTFECETCAIESFAYDYGLSLPQARRVWNSIKSGKP